MVNGDKGTTGRRRIMIVGRDGDDYKTATRERGGGNDHEKKNYFEEIFVYFKVNYKRDVVKECKRYENR